jgi:NADP-dependent 3-hydroxy acid dehydrogenase YdfG
LGRALVPRFSAKGAKVALVARYQAELDETIKDIRRSGGIAYGIVADVRDKESFCPIVETDCGAALWGRQRHWPDW